MNIFLYKSTNFGDAVSKRFWNEITHIPIYNDTNLEHYVTIGSVMHFVKNNSIIFGSGFISEKGADLPIKPINIIAVRGPLTRQRLIKEFNMYCPDNYGDPLILMPCLYNKQKTVTKNIVGIIPHYIDKNSDNLKLLQKNLENKEYEVKIIDIEVGDNYEQLIDEINDCKFIISSSLHGIIMGVIYKKKTCFIEFSNKVIGGQFKFNDFFGSLDIDFKYNKLYDSELLHNYIYVNYNNIMNLGNNLIKLLPNTSPEQKAQLVEIYTNFYKI